MEKSPVKGVTPDCGSKPSVRDVKESNPVQNVGPTQSELGPAKSSAPTIKASPVKK